MAPFRAKVGGKRIKKGENKNYRFVPFRSYPARNRKCQKRCKKINKIKKIPLWHHFKPKSCGKGQERERIKIIVSFRSYLTRYRKFQKNCKKIKKIKKYHYDIQGQNRLEKAEKERK